MLDVRGHVDTKTLEPGVEKSTYLAAYDEYLEGHIPVECSQGHPAFGVQLQRLPLHTHTHTSSLPKPCSCHRGLFVMTPLCLSLAHRVLCSGTGPRTPLTRQRQCPPSFRPTRTSWLRLSRRKASAATSLSW